MAGVNEVKYHHISSTEGWWNGQTPDDDSVTITKDDAKYIYKDCQQGFTDITGADLNDNKKAAAIKLNQLVNPDDVEYDDGEQRNVGQNQIDTDGTEKSGNGGAWVGGAGTVVGAAGTVNTFFGSGVWGMGSGWCPFENKGDDMFNKLGKDWEEKKDNNAKNTRLDAITYLAYAILESIGAAVALASVFAFDGALKNRKAETAAAETNNTTIDNYNDMMTTAMQTMVEEQEQYQGLSNEKFNGMMGSLDEITALRAELETYRSQGNMEKVNEIQAKIDELMAADGENQDQYDTQMDPLRENLETYSGNANEALGVHDSGSTVANFLQEGKTFGIFAYILGGINLICTAASLINLLKTPAACNPFELGMIIAGKVLYGVAAAAYGGAAAKYFATAKDEMAAGDAGETMAEDHLEPLAENTEGAIAFVDETVGFYDGVDGESGEAYGEAAEGADEAVNNTVNGGGNGGDNGGNGGNGDNSGVAA